MEIEGKKLNPEWINSKDGLPNEAIDFAEKLAEKLVLGKEEEKLTTAQVRSFFGEVRRIQMRGFESNQGAFHMLRPKLAYAAARAKEKNHVHDFRRVVEELIPNVKSPEQYNNFVSFMEAVVAYHRANGGR